MERAYSGRASALVPLAVTVATTVVATILSYTLPEEHAATGVGACFLLAVYLVVLRARSGESAAEQTVKIREHGLSLGGLFEPEPLSARRILRSMGRALLWALGSALLLLPPFWVGYVFWYAPRHGFSPAPFPALDTELLGQLLGIAFPEEAFYRGYLQSALDKAWPKTRRILGADLGPSLLVSSALFAAGHYLTEPTPARLAVFFPSLVFGYLRARTGGIGAPIVFHAACNLFATYLGRSYRLLPP